MKQKEEFQVFNIGSNWINSDEYRLNAASYSLEYIKSKELLTELKKRNYKIDKLENFADKIFVGARSKRLFTNKHGGAPYLMPIDLFTFNLKPRKWVRKETEDFDNWWVFPPTMLVTQSGNPGRPLLVNSIFEDKVVSPNVIRFVPNKEGEDKIGYIYAYLSSWIGQAILLKDKFGGTVQHIEPYHVGNLPFVCYDDLVKPVHENIMKAHRLREKAQKLLLQSQSLLYDKIGLPQINENDVNYFGNSDGKLVKSFTINSKDLNLRLGASYHLPIIQYIEKILTGLEIEVTKVGQKLEKNFIPPRFKRPYAKKENGVRYIKPSDLPTVRNFDIKYLRKTFPDSDLYALIEGDVLVVTDGSIGVISIVTPSLTGLFGSNNFARLKTTTDLHPGYLLVYLMSPYGQYQLKREIYGGVIDHLIEEHIDEIKIPFPKWEIQKEIGEMVIEAHELKDKAIQIENEQISNLQNQLLEISKLDEKILI